MALTSVTRFPAGVGNVTIDDELADLRVPSPLTYNMLYDDFNTYTAGNWTVAGTAAGVPAISTSADGGVISIPTTVTNPSETSISLPALSYTLDVLKDFFVSVRLQVDTATSGFFVGLGPVTASPIGTPPTNGVFISKAFNADPIGTLRVASANVSTATFPAGVVAAATWYDVAIAYTAADGALRGWVGSSAARIATSPTTFGAAVPMSLIISTRNGSANIRTMLVDNYIVAKLR